MILERVVASGEDEGIVSACCCRLCSVESLRKTEMSRSTRKIELDISSVPGSVVPDQT